MRIVDVAGSADLSPSKRARTETTTAAEERSVLRFAKLSEHATTPTRGSAKAAGYDLYRLLTLHIYSILIFTHLMHAVCMSAPKSDHVLCYLVK